MSEETVAVFFYGLFMDRARLASKGIHPSSAVVGHVEGYGIRIGSRATLLPTREARAYGVLVTMRAGDVAALYSEASVADYVAEPVSVVLADGSVVPASCYNLPEHKLQGANVEYARSLLALARELGLPDDYMEQIRTQTS